MADATPVYDLPFLEPDDAPDIAGISEDISTAVEAELVRIDANVAAINAMTPSRIFSTTDNNTTGTTFTAGTNPVGVSFVAPPSGVVFITLRAYVQQTIAGQVAICSYDLKTGSTVGSGTVVAAANSDLAIVAGRVITDGNPALSQGSIREMHSGLTPGAAYNAQVMFQTTAGGNCTVLTRGLLVEPSL